MDRLPTGRGIFSVSTSKRALPVYCVSRPSLAIHSSGLVNHGTSRSLRRRSGTSALLSSPIEFNIDDDSDDAGDDSGDECGNDSGNDSGDDSGFYLSDDGDDAGDADAGSEACNDVMDDASDFGAVAVEEASDDAGDHGMSRSLHCGSGTSALLSSPIEFNIDNDSDDSGDNSGDDCDADAGSEACNCLVDDASDFCAVAVEEAGDDAGHGEEDICAHSSGRYDCKYANSGLLCCFTSE
jgi:hypothetical protein